MFYELMGCDVKTGDPTRTTLETYDLKDVADELAKQENYRRNRKS